MTRTTFAPTLPLAAVLAFGSSSAALAGPPQAPVGVMKLDKVADGLRQYRQQKADSKRIEWLKRLAPSRDPRVEETLKVAMSDSSHAVAKAAEELLVEHYDLPDRLHLPPPRRIKPPLPPPPNGQPET